MRPVTPSRMRVGASIGALVLVGMGWSADGVAAQSRRTAERRSRALVGLAEEAPARRAEVLLALLPRLERDDQLRRQPDLHRTVTAMLVQERLALREAARAQALASDAGAVADVLMLVGLQLLPHTAMDTRGPLLSALVWGYYAPGSRFAADLALYGSAIVADVLALAADATAAHRANAYVLMGRVLNNDGADALEDALSVEQAVDLVNALRAGLDEEDAAMRVLVVDALAAAGDGASSRRLSEVARRDISPMVRQHARDAVAALTQ
jgi:hypothetical protein